MLSEIYPYVENHDANVIDHLIYAKNDAEKIVTVPRLHPPVRRPLTKNERFSGLLRVLSKYGGHQAKSTLTIMERVISMSSCRDPLELISKWGGNSEISHIMNMMNMAKAMGGSMDMSNIMNMFGSK